MPRLFLAGVLFLAAGVLLPDGLFSTGLRFISLVLLLACAYTYPAWWKEVVASIPMTPIPLLKPHECVVTRSFCKRQAKSLRHRFGRALPAPTFVPARHENREVLHVVWENSDGFMTAAFVVDRDGTAGAVKAFPHPNLFAVKVMSDAMLIVHAIQAIAERKHPWQFDSPTPPGY
jgi:hypothetical protein